MCFVYFLKYRKRYHLYRYLGLLSVNTQPRIVHLEAGLIKKQHGN